MEKEVNKQTFTNIRSLMGGLARTMNLVNPKMENHHEQTAYFAYFVASGMNLSREDVGLVISSALLHDVGSIVYENKLSVQEIEKSAHKIAAIGADIIRDIPGYEEVAEVIGFCQTSWKKLEPEARNDEKKSRYIKLASIVHLADVAASCLVQEGRVLNQIEGICRAIENGRGTEFCGEAVDAFLEFKGIEFIWLDAMHNPFFLGFFMDKGEDVTLEFVRNHTKLLSRIIDYRSSFTAMHSAGVAATARELAEKCGMTEEDTIKMEIAGYLHDIGKLVVPREILEKPSKLTEEEFNIIKEHPYYTRYVLMGIDGFTDIANWAGYHHEKLNGKGYPFHFDAGQLDKGSMIMAVADIFSALTEIRPYRDGMKKEQVADILLENVERGEISGEIVKILIENYEEIDEVRDRESKDAGARYFASIKQER